MLPEHSFFPFNESNLLPNYQWTCPGCTHAKQTQAADGGSYLIVTFIIDRTGIFPRCFGLHESTFRRHAARRTTNNFLPRERQHHKTVARFHIGWNIPKRRTVVKRARPLICYVQLVTSRHLRNEHSTQVIQRRCCRVHLWSNAGDR